MKRLLSSLLVVAAGACDRLPCARSPDCPVGFFCSADGFCDFECLEASECPQPSSEGRRGICGNDGRCRVVSRPPRIVVSSPEPGATLPNGLSVLTVEGSIESAAASVELGVQIEGSGGCSTRGADLTLTNPEPGRRVTIPFVEDLRLPPQAERIRLSAQVPGAARRLDVLLRPDCLDCPQAQIVTPTPDSSFSRLLLPRLAGTLTAGAQDGVWRVSDGRLQVMDGPLPVDGQRFEIEDIPLFQGRNTIEASFDGGRTRCAVSVLAPVQEAPLHVILTWDGPADLDLALVAVDGRLFELSGVTTPRSPEGGPGEVLDDFDGFGPELGFASPPSSTVLGIAVEAVTGPRASAFVRVLYGRELLVVPGQGPRPLQSALGETWLVALLRIDADGDATLEPVDRIIEPMELPALDGPESWIR